MMTTKGTLRGLFLPGYACTSQIWHMIRKELNVDFELTWVDWPTTLTPGFHRIEDFSHWLLDTIQIEQIEFIVGHSLGGLVALSLAEKAESSDPTIVLIESFLAPPSPFFQNLLQSPSDPGQALLIKNMMDQEKVHYSPELGTALREIDIRERVIKHDRKFHAIYGDRGSGSQKSVVNNLHYTKKLLDCMDITIIPNTCHFPMLENPGATLSCLKKFLL